MLQENLLEFKIVSVVRETPLANSYILELLDKQELAFKAGQFLTFLFKIKNHEFRRSYSIATLPSEPLKITVKKVENGEISRFILQNWKQGEIIKALPPAGRFTLEPQTGLKRDVFCFAAGSGIVPILPQVRKLLNEEKSSIIHLIYSNHNEEDALFLGEIESLAAQHPSLNLINIFSDPKRRISERGRLSNITTETLINNVLRFEKEDAVFLICGPFTYMRMLIFTIGLMGFKKDNIRKENFLPDIMGSSNAASRIFPDTDIEIKFLNETYTVNVPTRVSILDAALKSGIPLPYSCKGGVCGNCAAKCKRGEVYMSVNEVLTNGDLQNNWVLTCTAFPESSDVFIDFDLQ